MDTKELTAILVVAMVGCVIVAGFVPVVGESVTASTTFENDGYYYMEKISADDPETYTIEWNATTDAGLIMVNGKEIRVGDWGATYGMTLTIFATETDIFRVGPAQGVQTLSWIQLRGSTINYAQANSVFNATITGGNVSVQLDTESTPRTLTYTDAYMISADKSDYVMKKVNESVYMLTDSPIFSMGYSVISNGSENDNVVLSVSGTVEGVTVDIVRSSGSNPITFSDFDIVTTPVSSYVDLVKFDKITFVATDNDATTNMTYSYVIVPASVTAEKVIHADDNTASIISMLPFILIMGIVLMFVGVVIVRRYV